jgi:hypothetical protein
VHVLVIHDTKLGAVAGEIAIPGIVCDNLDC